MSGPELPEEHDLAERPTREREGGVIGLVGAGIILLVIVALLVGWRCLRPDR